MVHFQNCIVKFDVKAGVAVHYLMGCIISNSVNFLVFRIKTKDYCIQLAKAQVEQIGRKAPSPGLFCLLVRYSTRIAAHDITSHTDISCIIEPHIGGDLAEKPPPQMRENFLTPDLSSSGNFEQLWFLWQKSPPPPPPDEGKFF